MDRGKSRRGSRLCRSAAAGSRRHRPRPATRKSHRTRQGSPEELQRPSSAAEIPCRQGIAAVSQNNSSLKARRGPALVGASSVLKGGFWLILLLPILTASRVARNATQGD